jgi:hypothetical protein
MRGNPPVTIDRVLDECPSCASSRLEYEFRIDASTHVSRCTECGLLFLRERRAPSSAREDYGARLGDAIERLSRAIGHTPRTVLGVVPPGAHAQVSGADVIAADELVARGAPDPPYDAVVAVDALDRAQDASALLHRIRAVLVPGGHASFGLPSVSSSAARHTRAAWPGFRSGASTFYSVDTAQSLLIRHGFRDPKVYTDGTLRPGSVRARVVLGTLGVLGLRRAAVVAQMRAGILDQRLTLVATRGEIINRPRLSVIVPVYNERATFAELMDRLAAKEIDGVDIEIIVVESNSTDGSREQVLRYRDHPRVTLVLQDRPTGKGNAVRAGLERASGDIVLFQDADLEYEIDDYDDLLAPIRAYRQNFVIGSRHVKGSAWKIREFNDAPVLSQVFNVGHVVFLTLLNGIYGQKLVDPFSMFKVFRRDCLAGLSFECNRFDFDFEIVIKLLRKGYQPIEIPVNYHSRSVAEGKKVTMVRDPLTWLRALLRFRSSPLYDEPR